MKKARPSPRRRKQFRVVQFRDQIEVCGVTLNRQTLPNGKRMFEEEGVRELMVGNIREPTPEDFRRFEEFTRPEARH